MEITLDQVRELAARYDESGLGSTSSGRFLRSIVNAGVMPRGGGMNWLSDLISKGNPQNVIPLLEEIRDLMTRSGRPDTIRILGDIHSRVNAGWSLSEHKRSELERIRKQVNDALPDLELSDRQEELLLGLKARKRRSSYMYWASRPVISGRIDDIFGRWDADRKISADDWQFVRDNFKSIVEEFEGDRHPVGSLRWFRGSVTPHTILGEPRFNDAGNVVVETLQADRGIISVPVSQVLIRAPKLVQR